MRLPSVAPVPLPACWHENHCVEMLCMFSNASGHFAQGVVLKPLAVDCCASETGALGMSETDCSILIDSSNDVIVPTKTGLHLKCQTSALAFFD